MRLTLKQTIVLSFLLLFGWPSRKARRFVRIRLR
jgi:hypothetical protein